MSNLEEKILSLAQVNHLGKLTYFGSSTTNRPTASNVSPTHDDDDELGTEQNTQDYEHFLSQLNSRRCQLNPPNSYQTLPFTQHPFRLQQAATSQQSLSTFTQAFPNHYTKRMSDV